MAFHPREDILYVSLHDRVAMLEGRTGKPLRGEIEQSTLPTGGGRGVGLSPDGKVLYRLKTKNDEGWLALYDPLTGKLLTGDRATSWRPTAPLPLELTVHPTEPIVYLTCVGARVVELRDAHSGDYLFGSAGRSSVPLGRGVRNLVVDPRGDTLYVPCFDEDIVILLDARTGADRFGSRAASTVATGKGPLGVRAL
jgi:hypothetical protein